MQPGAHGDSHQIVPGRMKFDFIKTMTVAVEGLELRWKAVGVEAELDRFRPAERLAKRSEGRFRPCRALALDSLAQDGVAAEEVARFERRRLVCDLEHPGLLQGDAV